VRQYDFHLFRYVDFYMNEATKREGSQSISRAIRAMKHIARHTPNGMRLVDIAEEMNLERPTAHRVLKALVQEGMLVQLPGSKRYTLGPVMFELGLAATHQFNLRDICAPILERLAYETGDTSFLFVRSGNDAICLSRIQGHYPIQTPVVPIGSRQPLGVSAGGLALLSCLDKSEAEQILREVEPRLSVYENLDIKDVIDHYHRTHELGYAWISNHAVPGVSALGLPIRNAAGTAVAAITVATTLTRMTENRVKEILPVLRQAADDVANLLRP
jgi:DNA-binding IclR family transcriptional regulator